MVSLHQKSTVPLALDFIARLRDGPRHPAHLSVHAGDRIIAVNGFSEDAEASEKKHQGQRGSDVRNFRKKDQK